MWTPSLIFSQQFPSFSHRPQKCQNNLKPSHAYHSITPDDVLGVVRCGGDRRRFIDPIRSFVVVIRRLFAIEVDEYRCCC